MRKVISILFLLVFVFNTVGYKLVFYYLEVVADERIQSKIEQISDQDKELITIKIPINLPYHTDWSDFERVDGEVNFKGKIYKYVKQKIARDTLILLCINDQERTEINKQKDIYVKKINGLTTENNKKPILKQIKTDYLESKEGFKYVVYASNKSAYQTEKKYNYPSGFTRKLEMPPWQLLIKNQSIKKYFTFKT